MSSEVRLTVYTVNKTLLKLHLADALFFSQLII